MQPWVLIDTARIPGGTEDLRLLRRGTDYSINLGRELLMGSRQRGSEIALATLGCAALKGKTTGRILIGGLGMGFTLRAALDEVGPQVTVEVAELVPAVADWVRGPLAPLSNYALADSRVELHVIDVTRRIREAVGRYDAILLDVDNGPEGLTRDGNGELYRPAGLRAAGRALAPAGVLAVWSAFPDPRFTRRLVESGFAVREHPVRAHGGKGPRHTVWIAARPDGGPSAKV